MPDARQCFTPFRIFLHVFGMCEMVQKPRFTSVGQIARLQAAAMPTTSRVGDPEEDETMASARPVLSRINALGFVTVDSQMGTKGGGGYTHW